MFLTCGLIGFLLAACSGRTAAGSTECPKGERFFNGECRPSCSLNEQCASGICAELSRGDGVCLPAGSSCAYLASDTKCVGVDKTYQSGFRGTPGGYVTLPSEPYNASRDGLTDYTDGDFEALYGGGYSGPGTKGCQGNARYVTTLPTANPACVLRHEVVRCRRTDNRCVLVRGTTQERPAPDAP
jgi:hypothetical protein